VASLDRRSGELKVANLGDSGAFVIRAQDGGVALQTRPQQSDPGHPVHVMVPPRGRSGGVPVSRAEEYATRVQEGDLLVLLTDGISDNLGTQELEAIAAVMRDADPADLANHLVRAARANALRREQIPFSAASHAAGVSRLRGKVDDITVVVARVERSS